MQPSDDPIEVEQLREEVTRLKSEVQTLAEKAEKNAVLLEQRVRDRTADLEAALAKNQEINRALGESEAKFHGLVNQSAIGIAIIEDGKFSYVNTKLAEMFGYTKLAMIGMIPSELAIDSDRKMVIESLQKRSQREIEHSQYTFRGLTSAGTVIDVEVYGDAMEIQGKRVLISMVLDVTERVRAEKEILYLQEHLRDQSVHDVLTGLYNRRYLEESIGRELSAAERHGYPVSLIMGDLDHFKIINDQHGHLAGDEVLRLFGILVRAHARSSDICCRYGGEEFLLLLPRMTTADAYTRAEYLRASLANAKIKVGTTPFGVTASFGVASYPLNGKTGEALIEAADQALYHAKSLGRNQTQVSPAR